MCKCEGQVTDSRHDEPLRRWSVNRGPDADEPSQQWRASKAKAVDLKAIWKLWRGLYHLWRSKTWRYLVASWSEAEGASLHGQWSRWHGWPHLVMTIVLHMCRWYVPRVSHRVDNNLWGTPSKLHEKPKSNRVPHPLAGHQIKQGTSSTCWKRYSKMYLETNSI
jgi:hypothetical protein